MCSLKNDAKLPSFSYQDKNGNKNKRYGGEFLWHSLALIEKKHMKK